MTINGIENLEIPDNCPFFVKGEKVSKYFEPEAIYFAIPDEYGNYCELPFAIKVEWKEEDQPKYETLVFASVAAQYWKKKFQSLMDIYPRPENHTEVTKHALNQMHAWEKLIK